MRRLVRPHAPIVIPSGARFASSRFRAIAEAACVIVGEFKRKRAITTTKPVQ